MRIGLSGVLLWFGSEQLLHVANWVGYVPDYATALTGLAPEVIVLFNGSLEIAFGLLIFLGLFTRISAFVMGVHLLIIAFELGLFSQIGVRDWGLAAAFFGLAFAGPGLLSVDNPQRERF